MLSWLLSLAWPSLASGRALTQYVQDFWSSRDGLPQGALLSIFEDPSGILWLGSECCLIRFDGDRFEPLDSEVAHFGQHSFVRTLVSGAQGELWAGLVGGVAHYDGTQWHWFDEREGLQHPYVYALANRDNQLWVGTGGDGLWLLQNGRFSRDPSAAPHLPGKINDLLFDHHSRLWAATDHGLWVRQGDLDWQPVTALPLGSKVVTRLTLDTHGDLWLGTPVGPAHHAGDLQFRALPALQGVAITALYRDQAGDLWIGSTDAVYRINAEGLQKLTRNMGTVHAIIEDSFGNIWVGASDGLLRLRPGAFISYGKAESWPQDDILAILPRRAGGLWVIDATGSIGIKTGHSLTIVAPPGSVSGTGMLGLTETDDGALWIAASTLIRLQDGRITSFPLLNSGALANAGPALITQGPEGLVVAQTRADGTSTLAHFNPDAAAGAMLTPMNIDAPLRHVQRLLFDKSGGLWISSGGTGLIHVKDRQTQIYNSALGLPSDTVYGLTEDNQGRIWIATREGLAMIDGDQMHSFADTPGAPTRSPVHLHLDDQQRLWVTADDGVHRIWLQELVDLTEGRDIILHNARLGTRDGLRGLVVSWRQGGQASTADGTLYYATTRGLAQFDPSVHWGSPPQVNITQVRVGDQLWRGSSLALRDRRQPVEVRFSATDLTDASRLEFRTRLGGPNTPWSPPNPGRTTQFSNLAQGRYTFEVAVRRQGEPWQQNTARLAIDVPPYFYQRAWVQLLALAALVFAALAYLRWRLAISAQAEALLRARVDERTAQLSQQVAEREVAEARALDLARHMEERVRERTADLELAQLAVRNSEARFALAVHGAEDGIWDWEISLGTLYLSPRWKAILGYEDQEMPSTLDAWFNAVDPEDLDGLRDLLVFADGQDHLRYEYRMRHRKGHSVWVLCRGVVIRDAEGVAVRAAGSHTDITTRRQTEAALRNSLTRDPLTGLPNRTLFVDRLGQALLRGRERTSPIAVILFDIDRFKRINQDFGQQAGDLLLCEVAKRISEVLRETDTLARLGNDQFAVLLPEIGDENHAQAAVERIHSVLQQPFALSEQHSITLSISTGLKLRERGETTCDQLLMDTETALTQAKADGGGQVAVFTESLRRATQDRRHLEAELKLALREQQFVLHYQPLINLENITVDSVEALVRWQHPTRGLLAPGQFIGALEACSLMGELSDWVLASACAQAAAWAKTLPAPIRVAINLSSIKLNDPHLCDQVRDSLVDQGASATTLSIEIVESSVLETQSGVLKNLQNLRDQGVLIAIDDFGTGYSSFSYLQRLPVDYIKIDRSFVRRVPEHDKDTAICSALLAMIRQMGLRSVVEGVETQQQVDFFRSRGCPVVQGFYFSPALPAQACTDYILQYRNGDN